MRSMLAAIAMFISTSAVADDISRALRTLDAKNPNCTVTPAGIIPLINAQRTPYEKGTLIVHWITDCDHGNNWRVEIAAFQGEGAQFHMLHQPVQFVGLTLGAYSVQTVDGVTTVLMTIGKLAPNDPHIMPSIHEKVMAWMANGEINWRVLGAKKLRRLRERAEVSQAP